MSIFRRSLMHSNRPIRTYKAKFQMKFDPATYGTDNYALLGKADDRESSSGYNGYGQVLNYGLGFVLTYGPYEIYTPSGGVAQNYVILSKKIKSDITVHLTITNETTGQKTVYNDKIYKSTEANEGLLWGNLDGYAMVAVKMIHIENDNSFELENTTTEDEEFLVPGAQHTVYKDTGTSTVGRVCVSAGLSYGAVPRLLVKSKYNLLTNNLPTIYTVEITLESSEIFTDKSFKLWNIGYPDAETIGAKSNNYYIVRCNCKYGEFEGDSIFEDGRLEGVE